MSKSLNLLNKRYGKLLVIEYHGNSKGERFWKCRCDFGNITIVRQGHLRSGHTTSCGCNKNLIKSLIGCKFGTLTVLDRADDYVTPKTGKKYVQWNCVCDCGNRSVVLTNNLANGNIKSCGCMSPHKLQDLSGKVFGKLTVLKIIEPYVNNRGRKLIQYQCVCECGNKIHALANTLRAGDVTSCGCSVMSKGEIIAQRWLEEHDFIYELHKSFEDCLSVKGNRLNFDFYLPNDNVLIECNGIQHYESIDFFGGDERFTEQKSNDKLKKQYAESNGFKYLVLDCRKSLLKFIEGKLNSFFHI